jgi:thiol-disulfide isomerase/thioredoxin
VPPSTLTGLIVASAALLAATVFGLVRRARDGRPRAVPAEVDGVGTVAGAAAAERELLGRLGVQPGTPVTLLQFSSAFCAPCRTTRVLCADVAASVSGVRHIDVDAESHLDAVRTLQIRRTPTLLVIDESGRVVRRATGAPSRAHLLAAVAEVLAPQESGVVP